MTTYTTTKQHHAVWGPSFMINDTAQVDGETWYTIVVHRAAVRAWIRENKTEWWYQHTGGVGLTATITFDIHEKLYTMIALKYMS